MIKPIRLAVFAFLSVNAFILPGGFAKDPSLYLEGSFCDAPPYRAFGTYRVPGAGKNLSTRQIVVRISGQLHEIFFPAAACADLFNLDYNSARFSTDRGLIVLKMRGKGDVPYSVTFRMKKDALISRVVEGHDYKQTLQFR